MIKTMVKGMLKGIDILINPFGLEIPKYHPACEPPKLKIPKIPRFSDKYLEGMLRSKK